MRQVERREESFRYHSLRSTSRSIFLISLTQSSSSLSLSTRFLRLRINVSKSCLRPGFSSFVNNVLLSIKRFWMSSYFSAKSRWWEACAGSEFADVSVSSITFIASLYVSMWSWSSRFSAEFNEIKLPFWWVEYVSPWIPNPYYSKINWISRWFNFLFRRICYLRLRSLEKRPSPSKCFLLQVSMLW